MALSEVGSEPCNSRETLLLSSSKSQVVPSLITSQVDKIKATLTFFLNALGSSLQSCLLLSLCLACSMQPASSSQWLPCSRESTASAMLLPLKSGVLKVEKPAGSVIYLP